MTSLKVKLYLALESFLRVPPLLIVDEIFRISFGIGNANKYYTTGGILSPPVQRTTYIPDRQNAELSDSERLVTETFTNETVSSETSNNISFVSATTPQSLHTGNLVRLPLMNGLWRIISNILYEVFKGDDSQQTSTSSSASTSPVTTSTIVEEDVATKSGPAVISYSQSDPYEFSTAQAAADLIKIVEVLLYIALFFVAVVTFMLATENLIKLYSHLFSFLALYFSYIFTPFPSTISIGTVPAILYNIIGRCILAGIYYACRSWPGGGGSFYFGGGNTNAASGNAVPVGSRENNNANLSMLPAMTESFLLGMFFLTGAVRLDPVLYIILMIALHHPLLKCLPDVYSFLKSSWNETKRVQNEYGLSHLIQVESTRLRVNTVFRLFWITRAAFDAVSKCCNVPLNLMIKYVMTHGTETFTGVVGLTVTVSAICHHIGEFILYLLYNGTNTEADTNRFGSISTVLFFILSLQTGLTSLDPEKRLDRLAKNIILLGTALFHALHQMISPVLTAFRAFQTLQIRAAVLSCSSFIGSAFLTYYLLRHATISTWSLAVLALAIEFKIKIFISLLISFVVYLSQLVQYPEFLEKVISVSRRVLPNFIVRFFDHLHDELSHEDVVFYLRSVANVGEFLTGIFLFVNAVWIFFFESASAIRAIGMSVHAYFNIWCEAQKGWRVYCQRKTASQKIMSLADATDEQLRARQDDVCAVCYEEMESAKVTNCNHLFHAVCLRKWLYVQNTCPLCHEVLYREDALDNSESEANAPPPPPVVPRPSPSEGPNQEATVNEQPTPLVPRVRISNNNNNVLLASPNADRMHLSSDDNDTEPEAYLGHDLYNHVGNDSASSSGRSPVYTGISSNVSSSGVSGARSYRRDTSESERSSSGTEFSVDNSEDEYQSRWAEDTSSSDEDNDDRSRPMRNRGDSAIGVPLLL